MALGHIQSTQIEEDALFTNISGLARQNHWGLVSNYHRPFGLSELASASLGLTVPFVLPMAIGIISFGDSSYRLQRLFLAFAKNRGPLNFGIRVNHWIITIPGVNQDNSFSLDFGLQLTIQGNFRLGLLLTNVNQADIFRKQNLPNTLLLGSSYSVDNYLNLLLELASTIGFPIEGKFGLEYFVQQKLPLRTGFNTSTKSVHAGVGFYSRIWRIDYALVLHPVLGYSHQVGLKLVWGEK